MADVPLMSNPMTTSGDVIYGGASGAPTRLAKGSDGQVLKLASGVPSWAAASGAGTGSTLIAKPASMGVIVATNNTTPAASAAYAQPILIPTTMYLERLVAHMQAASSGTWQWGLFDYTSNPASCTKLAGGSGTLNGTGLQGIAATSAPVTINPGGYMLILQAPAANQGSMYRNSTVSSLMAKSQASYTWDDTPDMTTGWSNTTNPYQFYLEGDLTGSATW